MFDKAMMVGSDHAGFQLKEILKKHLLNLSYQVKDVGCYDEQSVHYPQVAREVAASISSGEYDRGILICGTGIGMSISANRFPGVRASLCHDPYTAKMTRQHNDSNVLVLGGRTIDESLALEILEVWLNTDFEGGRHQTRIDLIDPNHQ